MSSASVGPSIVGGGGLSLDTPQGAVARGVGMELSWLCGGGMEGCDPASATGRGDEGGCTAIRRGEDGAAGRCSMDGVAGV